MNAKAQAVLMSYFRAAAVAVLAMYMNGQTNPKSLAAAALAAIAGPALKALDPKSPEFGIGCNKTPQK